MGDFDGKVILVTGGATGLGAAIAIGAAKRGAKAVILNCTKSLKEAEATAAAVRAAGAEAAIAQGDVSEDADCRKIAAVAARFGRLDALATCIHRGKKLYLAARVAVRASASEEPGEQVILPGTGAGPGISLPFEGISPVKAFSMDDLPTFGRPTIASLISSRWSTSLS